MDLDTEPRLRIEGLVFDRLALSRADLAALPAEDQVADVSTIHPARRGRGVNLSAVLLKAGVPFSLKRLILHADRDDFHISPSPFGLWFRAVVLYAEPEGGPLPERDGGPFRIVIRPATGNEPGRVGDFIDDSANVKYLSRVEVV